MNENWKPVPGLEEAYEVSDRGRVRSIPRTVKYGRTYRGKERVPYDDGGSLQVNLCWNGKRSQRKVHHLVLEAFVGPRPDGLECRHLNDDHTDNRLENLRWGTSSENKHDLVRNGRHHLASKPTCIRGHELSAVNTLPGAVGRQCRACNAGRCAHRKGKTDSVQDYADEFFRKLVEVA